MRDAKGRRLEYLVDFQLESQRGDKAHARDTQKHRAIMRCLSWACSRRVSAAAAAHQSDYYVAQGKQAYTTVSTMDGLRPTAALFRKLAAHFETCVYALNIEKDWLRDDFYQYLMRQVYA